MTTQQSESAAQTATQTAQATGVHFPAGFLWGASTASFQIEGATKEDGRGQSIWDTFAATPGKVFNGDGGDPATDHYHRYREDIELMSSMGIGAYRFSIAWPRIQPDGKGRINQAGLDFYDRLVDELLKAGIEPWPTLYHWDLPQRLEDDGGWPNRDTAHRFAEYAAVVHGALGDRISDWATLNEPWCAAFLGYAQGVHAPGRTDPAASLAAVHHLLLGHGMAATAMRDQAGRFDRPLRVGLVHNQTVLRPHSDSEADLDAARRIDGLRNRIFTEPLLRGRYPEDIRTDLARVSDFGFVRDGDLAAISVPLDMLGINFYSPQRVAGGAEGIDPALIEPGEGEVWTGAEDVVFVDQGMPRTAMGWEIDATGLTEVLTRLAADYPGVPLYVTENGAAFDDEVAADGRVHDSQRVAYLDAHLRAAHQAVEEGVPLKGYFAWSLLDNFEWAFGYSKRFGLVHVDYGTQKRTVKDSGHWYSGVARSGSLPDRH